MAHGCEGELAASSSDRQHRSIQLVAGDKDCKLVAFLEHGPVEADRSAPAVGTGVGADELVDVGVGDRSGGGAHGRKGELSEELAFATGEDISGIPGAARTPMCQE